MDVLDAIKQRRSIRVFSNQDVPPEMIKKLIEAAQWAPSAGNIQPWEFIVVRDSERKGKLAEAALGQEFVEKVPVVIVVCASESRSSEGYGKRGQSLYCIQDTAAAIQNLLLTAFSLGLGTCWIGAFSEEETAQILQIPHGVRPVAIIPVGYPAEFPKPRSKRRLDQLTHYETY